MNNVTLPEVTVTPRNINLAGAVDRGRREAAPYISTLLAGTMFGPLPVLSEAIGSTTVDEATRELSKGKYNTWGDMMTNAGMNPVLAEFTNPGSYIGLHGFNKFGPRLKPVEDLAASGNKWARVISKTINKGTPSVEPLPNNVGWGPRQSIHVVHDTDAPTKLTLYNPERWDTGINNNMTEWLNSVDERDIIAFTKWLSKHSPAIAAPLIGGTLYDDKTSSELSELIYEDYGKFQVLNEASIIRTDEEIKELFNCKGEWEVTDGVTDMSF